MNPRYLCLSLLRILVQCQNLQVYAPRNVLKDVSHLASVSGGAYTAACYVTHLLKQPEPAPGTALETGRLSIKYVKILWFTVIFHHFPFFPIKIIRVN